MADREPKEIFEFDSFLKENGYKLVGMSETGSPIVQNAAGEEGVYDLKGLLESEGRNFGDVDVQYNTSSDPVQQSPVDMLTRAKLSFGNTRGNIKYLQNQFDEVKLDEQNGLVVKKDGIWHAVDPNLLGKGDAWDKTKAIMSLGFAGNKDIVGDLAELGPEAINAITTGVGATLGAAAGSVVPGAGTVAGGVGGSAVGGALSAKIRTSLGRLVGTYEASDEEELEDIGWEALMSAGGQTIAAGAKPAMSTLVNGAKKAGSWMSNGVKEVFSNSIGALTKAGPGATRVMLDDATKVGAAITKYANKANNVQEAVNLAAADKTKVIEEFLETAADALPEKYGRMLDDLVTSAEGSSLKVNMKQVTKDAFKAIEEAGIVSYRAADDKAPKAMAEGFEATSLVQPKDTAKKSFKLLSTKEFGKRAEAGKTAELLSPEERQMVEPILKAMNQFGKTGTLEGKAAATALKGFEKNLNKLSRYAYGKGNPQLEAIVSKVTESYRNSVAGQFDNAGLSAQYTGLSQLYNKYGDAVKFARKTLQSEKGVETLANQLVTPAGKQVTSRGLVQTLNELTGKVGTEMLDKFSVIHAAEKFLPNTPKVGLFQAFGAGSLLSAPIDPVTKGMIATGAAAASTPRLVARTTQLAQTPAAKIRPYAQHGLDFLKQRTPEELKTLLSNDELFQNFVRPLATATLQEETDKEALLRGSGVK